MTVSRSDAAVLRAVTVTNNNIRAAAGKLDALHIRRRDLYLAARTSTPPVPYKQLAEAAGTTEAAVMQVVAKGMEAAVADAVTERITDLGPGPLRKLTKALIKQHPDLTDTLNAARTTPIKDLRRIAAG